MLREGSWDSDNDDDDMLLATFGMLKTDLIDMLAGIEISRIEIDKILLRNPQLAQQDANAITSAIETMESLLDVFSLGGEISEREIQRKVHGLYAKLGIVKRMDFLQNETSKNTRAKLTSANFEKEPDKDIKTLFGEENI